MCAIQLFGINIGHIRVLVYVVEWFLWTIEHTNRSLDNSNATFRPSRASSGIQSLSDGDHQQPPFFRALVTCYGASVAERWQFKPEALGSTPGSAMHFSLVPSAVSNVYGQ